jgi:hypothetical protein
MLTRHAIIFDLETIPDLAAAARIHGTALGDDDAARQELGDKFPKLPLHKIACIGAVVAEQTGGVWVVRSISAPHIEERSEADLIQPFVEGPEHISLNLDDHFDLDRCVSGQGGNANCGPSMRPNFFTKHIDQ